MRKLKAILQSLNPDKIHNIRVIILSIIAAATFWFLNALNDSYSTTIKYPFEIVYDTETYIAVDDLPDELQINVNGLGWNLFRSNIGLNIPPIQFQPVNPADVRKIPSSTLVGAVTDQLKEFEVNFILTDTVYLNIDKKISKGYKLVIDSANIELESGFWISSSLRTSPDSVILTGPESILTNLGDTILVKVSQDDIDENFSEDIPIEVPNLNLIARNPPTIGVSFDVEEFKTVTSKWPIRLLNFPQDSSALLSTKEIAISYDIGLSMENSIDSASIEVSANFQSMNKEDSTIIPEVISKVSFIKNLRIDSVKLDVIYNEQ